PFKGCALACTNRVPSARGLGSSAAAWVGGLVAGNALLGAPLTKDALLSLAARAEGHPDNVAAAIFGGLTVSCVSDATVTAVPLPVPASLRWVVLIPEVTNATADARAVLPTSVPHADAVFNVQRVALLLASLWAGRGSPRRVDPRRAADRRRPVPARQPRPPARFERVSAPRELPAVPADGPEPTRGARPHRARPGHRSGVAGVGRDAAARVGLS